MTHDVAQRPPASAARYAGDDYQHLVTWRYALDMLRGRVVRIEMEVAGKHNLDDVVLYANDAPPAYHQVKFVMSQQNLMDDDWFITTTGDKPSILARFWNSYHELTQDGQPTPRLVLYTNRQLSSEGPLARILDGQSDKLVPLIREKGPASANGKLRSKWSSHLSITEEELLDMLQHLEVCTGRTSIRELTETCAALMDALGLASTDDALDAGVSAVRTRIRQGNTFLDRASLDEILNRPVFARGEPRATLCIQQIDRVPQADVATAAVDWVDLFDGSEPRTRRLPLAPEYWNQRLRPELQAAVREIDDTGLRQVSVSGAMRLSVGFLVGNELGAVRGHDVSLKQRPHEWNTDGERTPKPISVREINMGQGSNVAVGISISADVEADVDQYIRGAELPVGKLVLITPEGGAGRTAIAGEAEARGLADAVLDVVREQSRGADGVHLFMASPLGFAVLLGHIWNRVRPTQLYEDTNIPGTYAASFFIPA